ncbi:MAG TPA: T9SS type A sorting domain-containing protein [Flavobacterium sp.]|jgi:uncharacterized delta-60 repeat protein
MNKILLLSLICIQNALAQDGGIDFTFESDADLNNTVQIITVQDDGKILVGGLFSSNLYRLNNDGTQDNTFMPWNSSMSSVLSIAVQNDAKIIIGGTFQGGLRRLNSDGSTDASFVCNIPDAYIKNIEALDNGKIMVAGFFSEINGTEIRGIARLNSDGSLDTSFNCNLPVGTSIRDFGFQSDGKLLIAGESSNVDNPSMILLFRRYNTNNSQDVSFNNGGNNANSNIYDIEVLADDKVLITGWFTEFNSISRNCIAKLNSDGSLDTSFASYNLTDPETGDLFSIFGAKELPDNKYLINGSFHNYGGLSSNGLAKINADGTRDNSFNVGTGADDIIWNTAIQDDGKVLIGGQFTSYNATQRNKIARLGNTLGITQQVNHPDWVLYPNPCRGNLSVSGDAARNVEMIEVINSVGQRIKTQKLQSGITQTLFTEDLPAGAYILKIFSGAVISYQKFVKI